MVFKSSFFMPSVKMKTNGVLTQPIQTNETRKPATKAERSSPRTIAHPSSPRRSATSGRILHNRPSSNRPPVHHQADLYRAHDTNPHAAPRATPLFRLPAASSRFPLHPPGSARLFLRAVLNALRPCRTDRSPGKGVAATNLVNAHFVCVSDAHARTRRGA